MIYNPDMETMNRADMEKLQLERLKRIVRYCYDNVKLYHDRFDSIGLDPDKFKTLSDIQYIPPTTKEDLKNNYPFGMFAVPKKEIVRIHASSGTTGKPTVVGYTRNDLNMWSEIMARLCVAAGATEEDVAQIAFGYGLFTGALGLHYGLERLGAMVVPTSSGNTEKNLMLMKDFGVTLLIATPTYALYMGELAKELGYKKEDFKLRIGMFGSEGCTVEMRSKIEEVLGLFATDNYGMSELIGPGVSGECIYREGLHIAEDHFLIEILDSNTLEEKPEGEAGEVVVTTLTKECIPLLRYRTRDISRMNKQPCKCGRTSARMDKIMGRSDDMLIVKGVNVFPSQIESVLLPIEQIGNNYMIYVTKEGYSDALEVKVELIDASLLTKYSELENLTRHIRGKLRATLGIDAKVNLVEPKSIEQFTGKAKRVVDLRNK
ncbi:phenylacetate--CoA ligase family protein [Youxingia wuxianensis]|uniref:Phenylacetate-coenzyme A ligase n=1 Tax=Youxingia wuxianensis TaxID=2763678 RepID=A0A926EQY0_9FIRM|nr:phenylacetate--CoA ligase [Youxingia wuxianensis]MBC8585022.1 phenylacetate--CoA ligase [Youxingia wuxianensis]